MNIHIQSDGYETQTDIIIFGVFEGETEFPACFKKIDEALNHNLSGLIEEGALSKKKAVRTIPTFQAVPAKNVLLIGLGKKDGSSIESLQEALAKAAKEAQKIQAKHVTYCVDSFIPEHISTEEVAHTLTESVMLANYTFDRFKSKKKENNRIEDLAIILCSANREEVENGVETGKAYAEGTCFARDLVNIPGNHMTPTKLSEEAIQIAERYGMEYDILDREEMEKLGMGALLAVAQGSEEPPKMIVLKYQGRKKWDNILSFVGKGLTFDTGGISLKPALNMHQMKMDMGGSAAVLGAMEIIGQLQPESNVLAVIPSTENMPGGRALKPGDVITSMSGKTIEVKNTDAEGRLILADGITYARKLGANYIVNVATLTGAIIVALAEITTGAVTNHEDFMIDVLESAHETGEYVWRLPNYDQYKEKLKSDVADLNNSPGRQGGSITAGLFLGEFAGETPWVHLDIAGTAWSEKSTDLYSKGGTGVMARTLAALADRYADKNV